MFFKFKYYLQLLRNISYKSSQEFKWYTNVDYDVHQPYVKDMWLVALFLIKLSLFYIKFMMFDVF